MALDTEGTPTWVDSDDAMVWAEEFCARFGTETIDTGLMVGWFANAMGTAQRHGYERGYEDGQRDTSHALMGLTDRKES